MYKRTDEADAVIATASDYYRAMMDADEAELRRLFHPQAPVIGNWDGQLAFASLDEFIVTTPDARTGDKPFDFRVENIILVGDTAVITVGNYCWGVWFTDHLSMIKLDSGWRIVAKTYYVHPSS